jgi:hypothetical protein
LFVTVSYPKVREGASPEAKLEENDIAASKGTGLLRDLDWLAEAESPGRMTGRKIAAASKTDLIMVVS